MLAKLDSHWERLILEGLELIEIIIELNSSLTFNQKPSLYYLTGFQQFLHTPLYTIKSHKFSFLEENETSLIHFCNLRSKQITQRSHDQNPDSQIFSASR